MGKRLVDNFVLKEDQEANASVLLRHISEAWSQLHFSAASEKIYCICFTSGYSRPCIQVT